MAAERPTSRRLGQDCGHARRAAEARRGERRRERLRGQRCLAQRSASFDAQVGGTVRQGPVGGGLEAVDLALSVANQRLSAFHIHLQGQPLDGGGIEMTSSEVTLGPGSNPTEYRGKVTGLEGTNVEARIRDSRGDALTLVARLQIDQENGASPEP